MDDRRFDALTRSLATGLSRRNVLKGLFGGAVLGGAAATGLDRAAAQTCPEGEFACGTGDCCNTAQEKCCDGVCISAALCCPSLPDCDACAACVGGVCQPIACGPCETCVGGECVSTCEGEETCCTGTVAAPYCAECCSDANCPNCWLCDSGTCVQIGFQCGSVCCQLEDNCCGGTICCPPSQCNQASGTCCLVTEFACGAGDNTCCDIATEKCCDGICISASLCCPSLPDCPVGQTCCEGVCEDLQNDPTNCGACAADCSADLLCCAGQCLECCVNEDCDPCWECDGSGVCEPILCEDPCAICDVGVDACVRVCPEDEFCCVFGPPTDQTIECVAGNECCEDDDCGECGTCADGFCGQIIAVCSEGLVSCCIDDQPICVECCDDSDCESCFRCDEGTCEPLLCDDPCEFCDVGVDECVRVCPEDQFCCVVSEPPDLVVECVDGDECCEHDDCPDCFSCINGSCESDVVLCESDLVVCCIEGRLECVECCGTEDCDPCFVCGPDNICHGGCHPEDEVCCETPRGFECLDECCPTFGDPCGLMTAAGGSPQLDCCDGLVCCEIKHGAICAECCSDHDCHKGTCCCKDGTCSEHCCDKVCEHDKDCGYGACCCKDGTCSEHCCDKGCEHDKDCGYGACCCHDGSCSAKCCQTYKPPVYTLPDTGSGSEGSEGGNIAAAAFGAAAVYLAARKLRQQQPDETAAED